MSRLNVWKIPNTNDGYIIYVQDPTIPKDIKAFFRRDLRQHRVAKMRIKTKDKYAVVTSSQRQIITGLMHSIAKDCDYDFDRILEKAKNQRQ